MSEYKVDLSSWERKELYEHFLHTEKPFWSVTFRADVTELKRYARECHLSFYHVMVWAVSEAMNRTDAFLYTIRPDGIWTNGIPVLPICLKTVPCSVSRL